MRFNNNNRYLFKQTFLLIIVSFFSFFSAFAQKATDTIYDLDVVNIIQSYEPILINSDKVPLLPDVPKFSKNKPDAQTYQFSDVKGKINYSAEDIRPIKMSLPQPDKQKFLYLKAGFGNYLTPLLNLSLVNPNQSKFRAGLNTDFIFSKAKKTKFQQYFDFKVKGYGEYFIKSSALVGASINTQFDQYHFYANQDSNITRKDIANMYKRFGANIYLKNIADKDFDYQANIGFNNTSNTLNQKETTLQIDLKGHYMFIQNIGAGANILINNVGYKDAIDSNKINRFSMGINPYAIVQYKIWKLKLGANIMGTNKKLYVLPSIQNVLNIYKNYLTMYNEWNSQVKVNSLHQSSLENSFIDANNFINQIDEKRTFVGLRGATSGFYYDLNFSQLVSRNALLYAYNEYDNTYDATISPKIGTFQPEYIHKIKALNPHIGLGYAKGNNYGAKISFDYFIYNKNSDFELIYKPKLQSKLAVFYNWNEKLFIDLSMTAYGKMNGLVHQVSNDVIVNTYLQPIKGVVDINLSASYFFTKNIGVFLDLTNISHQKYQHYIKYPSYGVQVIGGVKIAY
ncbi:MAG: hypothetical protein R2760_08300 [Chitinophagales bacterium]